jgi:hypothetical protein
MMKPLIDRFVEAQTIATEREADKYLATKSAKVTRDA